MRQYNENEREREGGEHMDSRRALGNKGRIWRTLDERKRVEEEKVERHT